jgi:hypothetical protein
VRGLLILYRFSALRFFGFFLIFSHRLFGFAQILFASVFESPSPLERVGVRSFRFNLRLKSPLRRDLGRPFRLSLRVSLSLERVGVRLLPPTTTHIKESHNKNSSPVHKLIAPSHGKACVMYLHYIPCV